jgi:hypothetical protein
MALTRRRQAGSPFTPHIRLVSIRLQRDTATGPDRIAETAPGTTALATAGWTEPLTTTWSRRALAALLIPALILLIVVLV